MCYPKRLLTSIILLLTACTLNGPVTTDLNPEDYANRSRSDIPEYQSPIEALQANVRDARLYQPSRNEAQRLTILLKTILESVRQDQQSLRVNKELLLEAGRSYEFDFHSFCVYAGTPRPVTGDGLYPGTFDTRSSLWIPQFMEKYENAGLKIEHAQNLLWGLLKGARFNDLKLEKQVQLLKIFPDAPVRFGNSFIENMARSKILSLLPAQVNGAANLASDGLKKWQSLQGNYKELETIFAPENTRTTAIPTTWVQHSDGYYVRLKAYGYSRVKAEIYVPKGKSVKFRPATLLALPTKGQRLGISPNTVENPILQEADKLLQKLLQKYGDVEVNPKEAKLIRQRPIDAWKVHQSSVRARELTIRNFGTSGRNDSSDAFRHFIWSGLSAKEVGNSSARDFVTAHENDPLLPKDQTEMDMHNNNSGLEAGARLANRPDFEKALQQEAIEALKAGKLKVISK